MSAALLQRRIESYYRLLGHAQNPGTLIRLWLELQGLQVVAGQREPMTGIAPGPLFDAYERGLQDGHTLTHLEATHGQKETTPAGN